MLVKARVEGSKWALPLSSVWARKLRHQLAPAPEWDCSPFADSRHGPARPSTVTLEIDRAAPADLQRVAGLRRRWWARPPRNDRCFSPRVLQPCQHLGGAVDGGAFLVAGDQKADRAFGRPVRQTPAPPRRQKPRWPISCRRRRGHKACRPRSRRRRDHAPSLRPAAPHRCGRRNRNAARRCRAGHRDFRPAPCPPLEAQAMAGKAQRLQRRFQHVQRAAHPPASPKDSGSGPGRGRRAIDHQSRSNSLIEVLARVFSSTRLTITAQ